MVIVNQDQDMIINFNNILYIRLNDAYDDKPGQVVNARDKSGGIHTLGFYKDEKRAEEILMNLATVIANAADLKQLYFLMPKE